MPKSPILATLPFSLHDRSTFLAAMSLCMKCLDSRYSHPRETSRAICRRSVICNGDGLPWRKDDNDNGQCEVRDSRYIHVRHQGLFAISLTVWSNFTANHHNHLQILQNKLARVLLHADIRTPIDKMMEDLNWDKLDCRWNHQLLVVTFKCLKEMAPVYMSSYFTFTHSAHERTTRSRCSNTLIVPLWIINAGKRTFQYRAATLWNRLPVAVRSKFTDMSLNEFKSVI